MYVYNIYAFYIYIYSSYSYNNKYKCENLRDIFYHVWSKAEEIYIFMKIGISGDL